MWSTQHELAISKLTTVSTDSLVVDLHQIWIACHYSSRQSKLWRVCHCTIQLWQTAKFQGSPSKSDTLFILRWFHVKPVLLRPLSTGFKWVWHLHSEKGRKKTWGRNLTQFVFHFILFPFVFICLSVCVLVCVYFLCPVGSPGLHLCGHCTEPTGWMSWIKGCLLSADIGPL